MGKSNSFRYVYEQTLAQKPLHQVSEARKANGVVLAEEFLVGPLVSVEAITYKGKTTILGITNRTLGSLPYFVEVSYSAPVNLGINFDSELKSIAQKLLGSLEVDYGAAHIEYILTKNGPILVEINPRLGGGMIEPMISESFNDDIYIPLMDIALGKEPRIPSTPVKATSTFEPEVRDGNLYSRGASDNKGQLWLYITLLNALRKLNASPPFNIQFVIDGEEEIGSPNFDSFLDGYKEQLRADFILISDTAMLSEDKPSIYVGLRGLLDFDIIVMNLEKEV